MKITPIHNFFSISINRKPFLPQLKLAQLSCDTVSFTGRVNLNDRIRALPAEHFPSEGLREYMLANLDDEAEENNILELHREYYSNLLNCKTLAEAKQMYPEFQSVIDSKDIDTTGLNSGNILRKIEDGKYDKLSLDNLSLTLLKKYYGELREIKYSDDSISKTYNLNPNTVLKLLRQFNIVFDEKYADVLRACRMAKGLQAAWTPERRELQTQQNKEFFKAHPEMREKSRENMNKMRQNEALMRKSVERRREALRTPEARARLSKQATDYWSSPEARAHLSKLSKERWSDPVLYEKYSKAIKDGWQRATESREAMSVRSKEIWANEVTRKKILDSIERRRQSGVLSSIMKERWADEGFRDIMRVVSKALEIAWDIHPEAKSHYSEVAKEFPNIGTIANKIKNGETLTDKEISYRAKYFKTCHNRHPKLRSELAEIQKQILADWGFYDENRDIDAIINFIGL